VFAIVRLYLFPVHYANTCLIKTKPPHLTTWGFIILHGHRLPSLHRKDDYSGADGWVQYGFDVMLYDECLNNNKSSFFQIS
jgi:hypothetical protein